MRFVVDANILFSALIKDSVTATLLCKPGFMLFCPEFVLEELEKYKTTILEKTSRNANELFEIINAFEEIITIVPKDEFVSFLEKAKKICPDPDDVMYFALALKLHCPLWSNDKQLKQQNQVKIYSTEDLQKEFDLG